MKPTSSIVRWGVAGTGWVATDFVAPAMLASDGSRICACIGSSRDSGLAFADRFDVERVHVEMDDFMADPGVDAVYIALPNALHHAAVLAAAGAGKHILCEKPFALDLDHALEMAQACRDVDVIVRIAHQLRLDAAIAHARHIVRSGRLGRLVSISLERASGLARRTRWRTDASQSGVIFDVGVHLLDLVQWLSGQRYAEVSAFTHPDRRTGVPDDTVTVLGRLDGGCQAVTRATREVARAENNLVIQGSKASLVTSALRFASEHVVRVHGPSGIEETRFPASSAYELQVVAFEGELRGERSVLPDADDAAGVVAVTGAILESARDRRIVAVPGR